jgi:hypothetical protein
MYICHSPESGTPGAPLRPKSSTPRSGFVQPMRGADGDQPSSSVTNPASVAAGPRRSRTSLGRAMKLLRMIGLQALVIAAAAFLLAYVIRFPDSHLRPPAPYKFFGALLVSVSLLIAIIAWLSGRRSATKQQWATVAWMSGFWLMWWYVAAYLWINTYGT